MTKWIAAAVAIVVRLLLAFGAVDAIELPVRDAALRLLKPEPAASTVVMAIDEASLLPAKLGPWPWSRPKLAALIDRIAEAGAIQLCLR